MKALRLFLLCLLVTAGILISAAPLIAATQNPSHPAAVQILGNDPTPTPTPVHTDGDECNAGGC